MAAPRPGYGQRAVVATRPVVPAVPRPRSPRPVPFSALPRDAPSLEALRTAVDELDVQVTILAPDGRVVHVNRVRRLTVAADPELAEQIGDRDPLRTAESGDTRARAIAAGIRSVLAGDHDLFELEYTRRSRWYALRATAMAVDGVGALVVQTDITDRRRAGHAGAHRTDPDAVPGLASRRLVAERLEELLASGPVGVVALLLRRTGPRSLDRLTGDPEDAVRRTAELVEQLVPGAAVTGRTDADRFVVLLPGADEAALRRAAVPLEAGWRARVGRPGELEATVETALALPGERGEDVLVRVAGGLALRASAVPALRTVLAGR